MFVKDYTIPIIAQKIKSFNRITAVFLCKIQTEVKRMINDTEMLTYILQNAEMGCYGIKSVRGAKCPQALDAVLTGQMARYGKIYSTAGNMLRGLGEELHRVSPLAKTAARLTAARDLKRDFLRLSHCGDDD